MKKLITTTFIAVFILSLNAQTPNWEWAISAGSVVSSGSDYGNSISTDINGNVYVTGSFGGQSITFGTTTLPNAGINTYNDIFVVKYDALGNLLWAKSAGGVSEDAGLCITTDVNGNVYVAGIFESSSITFGTTTLTNVGDRDMFIVKYDALGNVIWAKSNGGNKRDECNGIYTDANENVYITGYFFSPSITFGTDTLTNASSTAYNDIFVVKYNALGNVVWAKSAGGTNYDECNGISADANGNVYITGAFESLSITFGTFTLSNADTNNSVIFIVKYDALGNVIWVKSAAGTYRNAGRDISTDASGNIYVTGWFESPAISFDTTTLINEGDFDIFVVKYDSLGNVIWAKSEGGINYDRGESITIDASGNVYLIGDFQGHWLTIGATTLTNTTPIYSDILVVKYDSSGNVIWAKSAGGISHDTGKGIAIDASGNMYIAGFFRSPSLNFGTTTLLNYGNDDVFFAKLSDITSISDENYFEHTMDIFPNPASNYITIKTDFILNNVDMIVYNIQGQPVMEKTNVYGKRITLYPDDLPSGMYFIGLIKNNKVIALDRIVITY